MDNTITTLSAGILLFLIMYKLLPNERLTSGT